MGNKKTSGAIWDEEITIVAGLNPVLATTIQLTP